MTALTRVRTLLGAKDFATSEICLRSLVEYSADPVQLVVHEDGTLTDEHRDRLRRFNPMAEFIDRRAADERVTELLASHPRCRAFRSGEIMALKLFDISLLTTEPIAYCDSDFLFLRRYTGLFSPPDPTRPVFMTDEAHAYAVRPWHLWPVGRLRLIGRLNAGLTLAPRQYLELDFLEWLLGTLNQSPVFARRRYWTEQTCWAALAARSGASLVDPRQVVMASARMTGFSNDAVAIHFVATHRHFLHSFASRQRATSESPAKIYFRPGSGVSAAGMLWTDFRRRLASVN